MQKLFLLLGILSITLCGCKVNYSFTGASIAPDVKTISINYFPNYAALVSPILSPQFTEDLRDIFTAQTSLKLVDKSGDLHLEGEITDYKTAPTTVQSNETAAQNRLTVTVKVRFINTKDTEQNFESSFTRFADYSATTDLASVEETLIEEINDQLVQDIFNKSVSNW